MPRNRAMHSNEINQYLRSCLLAQKNLTDNALQYNTATLSRKKERKI